VPPEGRTVLIQRNGNVAFDCTDACIRAWPPCLAGRPRRRPRHRRRGPRREDISRPLAEQGGAIVEVNAGPGLLMHIKPAEGEPRPVGARYRRSPVPSRNGRRRWPHPRGRRTGTNGKTCGGAVARWCTCRASTRAWPAATACSSTAARERRGDRASWDAGHRLLMNRAVEAAVFENDSVLILSQGLPDRCLVGVVTNFGNPTTSATSTSKMPTEICQRAAPRWMWCW
jgi:cyanophycin synthetase